MGATDDWRFLEGASRSAFFALRDRVSDLAAELSNLDGQCDQDHNQQEAPMLDLPAMADRMDHLKDSVDERIRGKQYHQCDERQPRPDERTDAEQNSQQTPQQQQPPESRQEQ